jgi:threonine/homoserine/homoserine lactone efflux protein
MSDDGRVAPPWTWQATSVAGVVAIALHVFGGAAVEEMTGLFVVITVTGVLYLLYRWGQYREKPASDEDERTEERRKEMEAEAGGYGGNAGG